MDATVGLVLLPISAISFAIWVYIRQYKPTPASRLVFTLGRLTRNLFYAALVIGLVWYWLFAPERTKVADKYKVPEASVTMLMDNAPHGCAFSDAPLGDKHCHFEKIELPSHDEHGKVTSVTVFWQKVSE